MAKKSRSGDVESRKAQMELQRREITERLRHIKNKILVMSGKGGVGKSSVAAYLSVALFKRGYRVGLMGSYRERKEMLKLPNVFFGKLLRAYIQDPPG